MHANPHPVPELRAGVGGRQRAVALLLALVLALALLPAVQGGPAQAEATEETEETEDTPVLEARGIARVCPEELLDDDEAAGEDGGDDGEVDGGDDGVEDEDADDEPAFPDLGTTHAASVTCAAAYGLVSGYPDGTFRPEQPITRAQMATFVAAWLGTATGISLTVPEEPRFADTLDNVHRDAIEAIAAAGIVSGRADGSFDPAAELTRGQFTRAVANAISYADVFAVDGPLPPELSSVVFDDVAGTTFESTILALAGVGVALGTGDGAFSPDRPVTRGQLATFLLRSADYLDVYQRWLPTALEPVALEGDLVAIVEPLEEEPADDDGADDGAATGSSDDGSGGDGVSGDDGDGASGDGGDGGDDGDDGSQDPAPAPRVIGSVRVVIDAFGGLLSYETRVTELTGSTSSSGALELVWGDPALDGRTVLVLDDEVVPAPQLRTGEVFEADSSERFAALLGGSEPLVALLRTEDVPEGIAVAVLVPPES